MAYALDATIVTSFWCEAVKKEMKNVLVAFDVLQDGAALHCLQIISSCVVT